MSRHISQDISNKKQDDTVIYALTDKGRMAVVPIELEKGLQKSEAGDIQGAREQFAEVLNSCLAVTDPSLLQMAKLFEAYARLCLAELDQKEGNSDKAKTAANDALKNFQETGDHSGISGSFFFLATIAQESGNNIQAVLLAEKAIDFARESNVKEFEAQVIMLQATSLIKLDHAGAIAALWQVRNLHKKFRWNAKFLKALDGWIKSVISAQPQDERQHIIDTLSSSAEEIRCDAVAKIQALAMLQEGRELIQAGAWQKGLEKLREARQLFSDLDDQYNKASASIEIGDVQMRFGDYELARMSYLDAQRYLRKLGDENGIAVTQLKLGTLALYMYQAEEAQKQLQTASRFFRAHGDTKRAEISEQLLTLAPQVKQPAL